MPFLVHLEVGGTVEVAGDSFEMTKASNPEYVPGSLLIYKGETIVECFVAAAWQGIRKPGWDRRVQAKVLG